MRRFLLSVLVLCTPFFGACRPVHEAARPYQVAPQDFSFYKSIINKSETSENIVTIKEDNYPIQLKLYEDGRFSYRLRKLGDGWGKWTYRADQGYLDLYAERTIFVMQMQIRNYDPTNPKAIALEFSDRFGPKFLKMDTLR